MAALLLGLLVASARDSYDTRSTELTQMAADAILLDPCSGALRTGHRASAWHS